MVAQPIAESELLAPRDPSLDDNSDAWTEFELSNVLVYQPDDPSTPVSLLEASLSNPLSLVGQLSPLPDEQAHLLLQHPNRRAPLIEVSEVRLFSYGQYATGDVGLWAAGKAGWFLLKPSRAYKATWSRMIDAVKVLYFISDAYKEERKSGKGKSATLLPDYSPQELFEKYATEVLGSEITAVEAAGRIYRHVEFLFASMLANKEGVIWNKTPIYKHLHHKFPAEYTAVRHRLMKPPAPRRAQGSRATSVSSETSATSKRRGRVGKVTAADVISIASTASQGAIANDETTQTGSTEPHLRSARSRRQQTTPRRSTEEPMVVASTPKATSAEKDSDEEPHYRTMKGRSALRPRSSRASKGTLKGGKAPVMSMDDDDSDARDMTRASKRKREEENSSRHSKQHKGRPEEEDDNSTPSSPGSEGTTTADSDVPPHDDASAGAVRDAENSSTSSLSPAAQLLHMPDALQDDTWVCALDGCTHKVYQASQTESQRLIREHYALHAYDDDERVRLVKRLQHTSLPVNHLMERVRLQAKMEGFPHSRATENYSRFPAAPVLRY